MKKCLVWGRVAFLVVVLITFTSCGNDEKTFYLSENDVDSESEVNASRSNEGLSQGKKNPVINLGEDDTSTSEWDYIYFGNYPQKEIYDKDIISEIDDLLAKEGNTIGDVSIGEKKYRKICVDNTEKWGLEENGDKYVNVDEIWDVTEFRYFEWGKIKWRVLQIEGDKLLICTDMALDSQEYNEEHTSITWENCTLRKWLNGYDGYVDEMRGFTGKSFLDTAFTEEEKGKILSAKLENNDNPITGSNGGNRTTDKVFILSYEEFTTEKYGFPKDGKLNTKSRGFIGTDYAKAIGAHAYDNYKKLDPGVVWVTCRTPGKTDSDMVQCCGMLSENGYWVTCGNNGIVMAMYVDGN